ncbi:hypothetical protein C2G38_2216712 [Gigaspora rosea]|uniref:F-box domain-containing protein n=1 Tax=Gigaspora rosea TaxID=44941 RepID=A0A397U8H3_9GLOM|nr:hypothetical protein C2G38_2216712 [Gigaspora rosea]
MSIPILWQNPFSFDNNSMFISQYFSSLDENERLVLKEYGINLNFQPAGSKPYTSSIDHIINLLFKLFVDNGATLRKLELYSDYEINPEIFYSLGRNEIFFSQLQDLSLSLSDLNNFNNENAAVLLKILAKNSTKIIALKIDNFYSDYYEPLDGGEPFPKEFHGIISALESQNNSLKDVTIKLCKCSAEFKVLMNCKNLEILRIKHCANVNILEASLNTLEITSFMIDASEIVQILKKSSTLLQRLSLVSTDEPTWEVSLILKTIIGNLQKLQFLTLRDIFEILEDEPEILSYTVCKNIAVDIAEKVKALIEFCIRKGFLNYVGVEKRFKLDDNIKKEYFKSSILSSLDENEKFILKECGINVKFPDTLLFSLEWKVKKWINCQLASSKPYTSSKYHSYIDTLFNNCYAHLKYLLINRLDKKKTKALVEFCIRKRIMNYMGVSIDLDDNIIKKEVEGMTSKMLMGDMPELMEKILNNLNNEFYSLYYLYSCALVSRHWCKMSIPILWQNPFSIDLSSSLFIPQYFSSLDENGKFILQECGINVKYPNTLFNYAKFLKVFDLPSLEWKAKNWINFQLASSKPNTSSTYRIINLLFKLIVESGASIHKLNMHYVHYELNPEIFYSLERNEQFFSRLQDLSLCFHPDLATENTTALLKTLAKNATKISTLKLENFYPTYVVLQADCLVGLDSPTEYQGIISSLESQKNSLQEVIIRYCKCSTEFKVLKDCKNLEILRIKDCNNEEILEARLNTLEITRNTIYASSIVQILQKSGTLLQRLSLVSRDHPIWEESLLLETLKSFYPNITYLKTSGVRFSTQFLELFANLQKLQFLTLCDIYETEDETEIQVMQFAKLLPFTLLYLDLRDSILDFYINTLLNNCYAPLKYLLINRLYYYEKANALIDFCIRKKSLNYVGVSLHLNKIKKELEGYVTVTSCERITKLSKRAKAVIPSKRKLEILKSRKKETKELEDLRKEQQEQTSTERDSLTKTHIESENQRAARKILAMDRESSGKHTDNECISTLIREELEVIGIITSIKPLVSEGTPISTNQWVVIFETTNDSNLTKRLSKYTYIWEQKVQTEWKKALKVCFYCDRTDYIKQNFSEYQVSIELRKLQKKKEHYKEINLMNQNFLLLELLRGKTINSDKDNQESIKKDKNKSSSTTELDQKFLETIPKPSKNTEEITEEITEDALMQDNSFIVVI